LTIGGLFGPRRYEILSCEGTVATRRSGLVNQLIKALRSHTQARRSRIPVPVQTLTSVTNLSGQQTPLRHEVIQAWGAVTEVEVARVSNHSLHMDFDRGLPELVR